MIKRGFQGISERRSIPVCEDSPRLFEKDLGGAGIPITDRVMVDVEISHPASEKGDLDPDAVDGGEQRTVKSFLYFFERSFWEIRGEDKGHLPKFSPGGDLKPLYFSIKDIKGSLPTDGLVEVTLQGIDDHTEIRTSLLQESHHHTEPGDPLCISLGAIQRVHQPGEVGPKVSGKGGLFSQDRVAGESLDKAVPDDLIGLQVRLGHDGVVGLPSADRGILEEF